MAAHIVIGNRCRFKGTEQRRKRGKYCFSLRAPLRLASSNKNRSQAAALEAGSAELFVKSDSSLGVSIYPDFAYDGQGGNASGRCYDKGDGRFDIEFDPETIKIPALCSDTTTLLGLPIPPPLSISIVPKKLSGYADINSGEVQLNLNSLFCFSIGRLYSAPPLQVITLLTTQKSTGRLRSGVGSRLDLKGVNKDDNCIVRSDCRLVGVASVPKVPIRESTVLLDILFSAFLQLPTEALANLSATLKLVRE